MLRIKIFKSIEYLVFWHRHRNFACIYIIFWADVPRFYNLKRPIYHFEKLLHIGGSIIMTHWNLIAIASVIVELSTFGNNWIVQHVVADLGLQSILGYLTITAPTRTMWLFLAHHEARTIILHLLHDRTDACSPPPGLLLLISLPDPFMARPDLLLKRIPTNPIGIGKIVVVAVIVVTAMVLVLLMLLNQFACSVAVGVVQVGLLDLLRVLLQVHQVIVNLKLIPLSRCFDEICQRFLCRVMLDVVQ